VTGRQRRDTTREFSRIEGLLHRGLGADLSLPAAGVQGGKDEDGHRVAFRAQPLVELTSSHHRHFEIQHDRVGRGRCHCVKCQLAFAERERDKPFLYQNEPITLPGVDRN